MPLADLNWYGVSIENNNQGGMQARGKGASANAWSGIYSEFSRQQFNKYKLKFPKLKESEITKKVWKEWEEMTEKEKEALRVSYLNKGLIQPEDKSPKKKEPKKETSRSKSKNKEKAAEAPKPALPIVQGKTLPASISRQSKGESIIAQAPASQAEDSSDVTPDILKQKKPGSDSGRDGSVGSSEDAFKKRVERRNYGEYIQFFRFYFQRLTKEHPKWSPNQKTVIIRLLWKKRQLQKKKEAQRMRKGGRLGSRKRVAKEFEHTQYTFFVKKRIEEYPDVDPRTIRRGSMSIWKKLHRSGKDFYRKQAIQYNRQNPVAKRQKKVRKESNPVSFLNNMI